MIMAHADEKQDKKLVSSMLSKAFSKAVKGKKKDGKGGPGKKCPKCGKVNCDCKMDGKGGPLDPMSPRQSGAGKLPMGNLYRV